MPQKYLYRNNFPALFITDTRRREALIRRRADARQFMPDSRHDDIMPMGLYMGGRYAAARVSNAAVTYFCAPLFAPSVLANSEA